MWLLLVLGCGAKVECEDACPDGSSIAKSSFRMDSFQVSVAECTAVCDPIQPCFPPNVPVFQGAGEDLTFECRLMEGFGTLTRPEEVDMSFGRGWRAMEVVAEVSGEALDYTLTELSNIPAGNDIISLHWQSGEGLAQAVIPQGSGALFLDTNGDELVATTDPQATGFSRYQALMDVNLDGFSDSVTFNPFSNAGLSYCLGDGTGYFLGVCSEGVVTGAITVLHVGDADGDGDEDLLVLDGESYAYVENNAGVLLSPVVITQGIAYSTADYLSAGDVNGDGLEDVFVGYGDGLLLLGGNSGWTNQGSVEAPFGYLAGTLTDTDGDSVDEMLAYIGGDYNLRIGVYRYSEGGFEMVSLSRSPLSDVGALGNCQRVDWNGDGLQEMACSTGRLVDHDSNGNFSDVLATRDGALHAYGQKKWVVLDFASGPHFVGFDLDPLSPSEFTVFRSAP